VDGGGAADGFGTNFTQADVADIPGLDHVGDGADCVFDGDVGVEPGGAVDVDVVHAEALQSVGECGFDGCRAGVVTDPRAVG
jgi:hypothetical protein